MVDRLPEFQGPKYAGSFRRGDFADFHQRFSLVPRRCAGKYPPAAREIGHGAGVGRVGGRQPVERKAFWLAGPTKLSAESLA